MPFERYECCNCGKDLTADVARLLATVRAETFERCAVIADEISHELKYSQCKLVATKVSTTIRTAAKEASP